MRLHVLHKQQQVLSTYFLLMCTLQSEQRQRTFDYFRDSGCKIREYSRGYLRMWQKETNITEFRDAVSKFAILDTKFAKIARLASHVAKSNKKSQNFAMLSQKFAINTFGLRIFPTSMLIANFNDIASKAF